MQIDITENQKADLTFIRSKRARNIRLQINSDGQFSLIAPRLMPQFAIKSFLVKHTSWIKKQWIKIEKQKGESIEKTELNAFTDMIVLDKAIDESE